MLNTLRGPLYYTVYWTISKYIISLLYVYYLFLETRISTQRAHNFTLPIQKHSLHLLETVSHLGWVQFVNHALTNDERSSTKRLEGLGLFYQSERVWLSYQVRVFLDNVVGIMQEHCCRRHVYYNYMSLIYSEDS